MLTLPQAGAYRSNIPSLEDNRGKEALANGFVMILPS